MGRTNPTYRDRLRAFEDAWTGFRRGLRRERQGEFDALFERADRYAAAAGQANPADPDVAVLLSMLVGHERELGRLRERVAALEDAADTPDAGDAEDAVGTMDGAGDADDAADGAAPGTAAATPPPCDPTETDRAADADADADADAGDR
jgi:hypothetical protein